MKELPKLQGFRPIHAEPFEGKVVGVTTFRDVLIVATEQGVYRAEGPDGPLKRVSFVEGEIVTKDELAKALGDFIERIDENGGLGAYKGGPPWAVKQARELLAKYARACEFTKAEPEFPKGPPKPFVSR